MRISLTNDLWKQIQSAQKDQARKLRTRQKSVQGKQLDLSDRQAMLKPFSDEWIDEPDVWFVRFVKIDRRQYLALLHASTGLVFHVAGIRASDLAAPIQLIQHWIRQGLITCGLEVTSVDAWIHAQGEMVFFDGGSRSLVSKINQAFRENGFDQMDLARPIKRELAVNSLFHGLYYGYHHPHGEFGPVLDDFCKVFLPDQTVQPVLRPGRYRRISYVEYADGTPVLPLPGVEVTVELCRFGSMFDNPIGGPDEERLLPVVRRVIHVPIDSNLFQLNQAIQASLGLLAYHHYRFYPATGPDAQRPMSEIYCWDAPPDYPYDFVFAGPDAGATDGIGNVTGGANQKKQEPVRQLSDLSITIREILAKTRFMFYQYDLGDDWVYTIQLAEGIRVPGFVCLLADGEGDPPPVDVGGLTGWQEFLKALARPRSSAAAEMLAWAKVVLWSPFDLTMLQERFARLDYLYGEYWAEKEDPDAD